MAQNLVTVNGLRLSYNLLRVSNSGAVYPRSIYSKDFRGGSGDFLTYTRLTCISVLNGCVGWHTLISSVPYHGTTGKNGGKPSSKREAYYMHLKDLLIRILLKND